MFRTSRKAGFSISGDRVLVYAALFLVCSLISFFGAGDVAAFGFLPAALAVELIDHARPDREHRGPLAS